MVYLSDYLVGSKEDRYLLTIINHFSKFGVISIIPNKKSTKVLKALKGCLRITSKPRMIQSDNGGELNNDLIKDLLKYQGIEYIRGSPYHPSPKTQMRGLIVLCKTFFTKQKICMKFFYLNDSI